MFTLDHSISPFIEYSLMQAEFTNQMDKIYRNIKRLMSYRPVILPNKKSCIGWEFLGYRPYSCGDDFSKIDWNVYQRLQHFVIKEYAVETFRKWTIVWDVSASMSLYHKFSFSKQLIAMLSYVALYLGDTVRIITIPNIFPEREWHGIQAIIPLFSELDSLQPIQDSFNTMPKIQTMKSNSKIIWISDFYGNNYENFFIQTNKKNLPCLALHIMSLEEIKPPYKGKYILQDIETKIKRILHITPTIQKNYEKYWNEHIQYIQNFCHHYGIIHLSLIPQNSLEKYSLQIFQSIGLFH